MKSKKSKPAKLRIFKVTAEFTFASDGKWKWHKEVTENKLKEWGAKEVKVRLR